MVMANGSGMIQSTDGRDDVHGVFLAASAIGKTGSHDQVW